MTHSVNKKKIIHRKVENLPTIQNRALIKFDDSALSKTSKVFFSNKPPKMKYRQNFLSFFSVWFNKSDIIMADVGPLFISFICRAATSRHSEWFIDSSRLQGC